MTLVIYAATPKAPCTSFFQTLQQTANTTPRAKDIANITVTASEPLRLSTKCKPQPVLPSILSGWKWRAWFFLLGMWRRYKEVVKGGAEQQVNRCMRCASPIGGSFFGGGGGWKSYSSIVGGNLLGMMWSTSSSGQSSNYITVSLNQHHGGKRNMSTYFNKFNLAQLE